MAGFFFFWQKPILSEQALSAADVDLSRYSSQAELASALQKAFKPGTEKQEIDRILLSKRDVKSLPDWAGEDNSAIVIIYLIPKPAGLITSDYPDSACYIAEAKSNWRYFFHFGKKDKTKDSFLLEKITWTSC